MRTLPEIKLARASKRMHKFVTFAIYNVVDFRKAKMMEADSRILIFLVASLLGTKF